MWVPGLTEAQLLPLEKAKRGSCRDSTTIKLLGSAIPKSSHSLGSSLRWLWLQTSRESTLQTTLVHLSRWENLGPARGTQMSSQSLSLLKEAGETTQAVD
jgi:hypothetical protein